MKITIAEAKAYLRVDSNFEDALISALLDSASAICMDMARLTADEWNQIWSYGDEEGPETVTVREKLLDSGEVERTKNRLSISVLYVLGFLYEHREDADHKAMELTLRSLLSSVREGVL